MLPGLRPVIRGLDLQREGRFRPLTSLRTIELGHFVAGPSLGSLLTMYGAEVIKVEPPPRRCKLEDSTMGIISLCNMGKVEKAMQSSRNLFINRAGEHAAAYRESVSC